MNTPESSVSDTVARLEGQDALHLISDQPTAKDLIGTHVVLADEIIDIVRSQLKKPFVIGLFGSWGSGKSSILQMVRERAGNRFELVMVDAWRKDKDNFLRQFIKKLARSLLRKKDADKVVEKVDFRTYTQESRWKPDGWATFVFWIYVLVALLFIGLAAIGWLEHNFLKDFGEVSFAILAAIFLQYFLPRYSRHTNETRQEITLDDPAWFRQVYFEDILGKTKSSVVCIAIDNLDRVPAEDALKIIRTIKTFIVDGSENSNESNESRVVFLVPCDDEKLAAHVDNCGATEDGRDFLRKFMNVVLRIPELQSQDMTTYVRNLLGEAAVMASPQAFDNLTFVITRAVGNAPRHPKYFINAFIARYHLALKCGETSKIVREHPDWLAVYVALEAEFHDKTVPQSLDDLRNEIKNASHATNPEHYSGRPNRAYFLTSVQGIIGSITSEAWYAIQYLKRPKVHELIPGFQELAFSAQGRKVDDFRKRFQEITGQGEQDPRQVLYYLWDEHRDSNSRMNTAHAILSLFVDGTPLDLPQRIVDDTASYITMGIPGWSALPPKATYQRILKLKADALAAVLSQKMDGPIDLSVAVLKLVLADDALQRKPTTEIRFGLDQHAPHDLNLVVAALMHPQFPSTQVLSTAFKGWRASEGSIKLTSIVEYVKNMPQNDIREAGLHELFGATKELLSQTVNRPLKEEDAEGILASMAGLAEGKLTSGGVNLSELLNLLSESASRCAGGSGKQAKLLISALIAAINSAKPPLSQNAVLQNTLRPPLTAFLQRGPEDRVTEFLREQSGFLTKFDPTILDQVAWRSAKLFGTVVLLFPSRRSTVLGQIIERNPSILAEWSEANSASVPSETKQELGVSLAGLADRRQSDEIYRAIGNLKAAEDVTARKALEQHFDRRIQGVNSGTPASAFETLLRHMQAAQYAPTANQKESIRTALSSLPAAGLTQSLKTLIDTVLGD